MSITTLRKRKQNKFRVREDCDIATIQVPVLWCFQGWWCTPLISALKGSKSQYYDVFRGGGAPLWFQHSKAEARDPSSRWRNTFNPSTREAEAGGSEFQGSQDYTEKLSERQTDRWDLDPITFKMKSSNFITSGLLTFTHGSILFRKTHTHIFWWCRMKSPGPCTLKLFWTA
jgi:hypothetical protein